MRFRRLSDDIESFGHSMDVLSRGWPCTFGTTPKIWRNSSTANLGLQAVKTAKSILLLYRKNFPRLLTVFGSCLRHL